MNRISILLLRIKLKIGYSEEVLCISKKKKRNSKLLIWKWKCAFGERTNNNNGGDDDVALRETKTKYLYFVQGGGTNSNAFGTHTILIIWTEYELQIYLQGDWKYKKKVSNHKKNKWNGKYENNKNNSSSMNSESDTESICYNRRHYAGFVERQAIALIHTVWQDQWRTK